VSELIMYERVKSDEVGLWQGAGFSSLDLIYGQVYS